MFGRIKHLIFVVLVIIAGSNSPAYALQTIQAGEYSISYKGGDFDKSIMKGNLTGVTFYQHQKKVASAKSVYFDHNFKNANFDVGDGITEAKIKLSFEKLAWLIEEGVKINVDKGSLKFSIYYKNRRITGGQFSMSSKNLNFQADLPIQSDDQAPKQNKIKSKIGSANIRASFNHDKAHIHDIELSDINLDWLPGGFGASLRKFSGSDVVFGYGYKTPEKSQQIARLFGVALGIDIGEAQSEDFKMTFGKGFQNKIDVFSSPSATVSNCWGYTILIQKVPSHVCYSNMNNVVINKTAIKQLIPEFAEVLSQNGVGDIMLDWMSETSIENFENSYDIKHANTTKVDNFGTFEWKSGVSINQKLFLEMVALEKSLQSAEDIETIYRNELLKLLDMTHLHEWNVTIKDDGLLDIAHSFIKNKSPAFSQMSRYQLSVEGEKMITEALKGQPGLSDMLNPSISRFINGAGEISLTINPQGEMSVYERVKLISDFDDFIAMFNVKLVN